MNLKPIRFIPNETNIPFVKYHIPGMIASALVILLSLGLVFTKGLNFGVDFTGGMIVEIRTQEAPDLADMRTKYAQAGFEDLSIQEFGAPTDFLLRLPKDQSPSDPTEQEALVQKLLAVPGDGVEKRRVEFVGPQVGDELIQASAIALGVAIIGIMSYIWFRFERPYAIGCVLTLIHDCVAVLGLFALTQMEFNLTSVASVLMILGYSINDTVVIYDYVREMRRKYKAMPWPELIDMALNKTLARTIMTGTTTLLALLCLGVFGGDVIRGFTISILVGIVVGTYSSLFVSAPFLLYMNPQQHSKAQKKATPGGI